MIKKIFRIFFIVTAGILAAIGITAYYLYSTADMGEPEVHVNIGEYPVVHDGDSYFCANNSLRRNGFGLWEAIIRGDALERGVAMGVMSKELLYFQEKVFIDQIRQIVPSEKYLSFLRVLTVMFNRDMATHIPLELRKEIYGISLSCTHDYDAIGTPYQRQVNYHAAHDIGHAMQEYMLVGCSSFGVWNGQSADSTLLIGRNFDFYVGDDFAENKLLTFCFPTAGYKFASVGWPGMTGVLSGMNEQGLTVTINAAKGRIPTSSAMPISILARTILQYASTIDEAYQIADTCKTFVSESLLIGSAKDGYAAIIEKTPSKMSLYESAEDLIICTNHYQSGLFANDKHNIENITISDSPYRFGRLEELIDEHSPLSARKAATILRDRYGYGNKDIGLANEKSINQSIAHHSVIFKPGELLLWVSTSPWQSGEYICYDLSLIFEGKFSAEELHKKELTIPADSLFLARDYHKVNSFREHRKIINQAIEKKEVLPVQFIDTMIDNNPELYEVHYLCGKYFAATGNKAKAKHHFEQALQREIPRETERKHIEKEITRL